MTLALSIIGGIAAGYLVAQVYVIHKERDYHKRFGV